VVFLIVRVRVRVLVLVLYSEYVFMSYSEDVPEMEVMEMRSRLIARMKALAFSTGTRETLTHTHSSVLCRMCCAVLWSPVY
jgi:hypothetical protein